jgi:hypothetical protein
MINSKLPVLSHHNALAGCQSIVFHHVGWPEPIQGLINLVTRNTFLGPRRCHPGCGHDLLGKCFAAFELGRGSGRAEAGHAFSSYRIGNSSHQWRLGPDHDQIDAESDRQICDCTPVQGVNRMVATQHCGPGVAGCCMQLDHGRIATQRKAESMLPSTRADH